MRLDNRQTRRLLDRIGVDMKELAEVQEVIIRTKEKEIVIRDANVAEVTAKGVRMFQVTGEDVEEKVRELPVVPEDDVVLVAQQTGVPLEKARSVLIECGGDIARAILQLTP